MTLQALKIYAGASAFKHIKTNGLKPEDIKVIAGAAGGPKGLLLGPLDRFIFGHWLRAPQIAAETAPHFIDLIGASIGAWRMGAACMFDPVQGSKRLEHDYIHQQYDIPSGQRRPSADVVSAQFNETLNDFFADHVKDVLNHPTFKLNVVVSKGKYILANEGNISTPVGYALAYLSNIASRQLLGMWLERTLFSVPRERVNVHTATKHNDENIAQQCLDLNFDWRADGFQSSQFELNSSNLTQAIQASCSIPFVMRSVPCIPGAPKGAYWDGGITDYHLHWDYNSVAPGFVLYPHFQRSLVPGWLDKALKWRHGSTHFLDRVIVLAPNPNWVAKLPNSKLPDRQDFVRYAKDPSTRIKIWQKAVSESEQLADEFAAWLANPGSIQLELL